MYRYASFVVRIRLDDNNLIVEGQISQVGSGKTVYFRDLDKVAELIRGKLSELRDGPGGACPEDAAEVPEGDVGGADRG